VLLLEVSTLVADPDPLGTILFVPDHNSRHGLAAQILSWFAHRMPG